MPKKPRKQHVTHYMEPNPWAAPMKGRKKPKKVKKAAPPEPIPAFIVNKSDIHMGQWGGTWPTPAPVPVEIVFENGALTYRPVETTEQLAQKYAAQYPGATPIDLMVAFHNEEKRKLVAKHQRSIDYHKEQRDWLCLSLQQIGDDKRLLALEVHELHKKLALEVHELRQQLNNKQAQHARLVACSIPDTESVRHFREE